MTKEVEPTSSELAQAAMTISSKGEAAIAHALSQPGGDHMTAIMRIVEHIEGNKLQTIATQLTQDAEEIALKE